MIIPKLAFRNIRGAGLRTWLNVIALSFSFVVIIFLQGLYIGMSDQAERVTVEAEYGGGQYWQDDYDPLDPLTLNDAHAKLPDELQKLVAANKALPILVRQATIYPKGRYQNTLLKGIPPEQRILSIPTFTLKVGAGVMPALIGGRMARSTELKAGDTVTVRWRDARGTFDANEFTIAGVMKTDVADIDSSQLWVPIETLRGLLAMPGEATIVVLEKGSRFNSPVAGWKHRDLPFLLQDIRTLFLIKTLDAGIFYVVLLLLAMLAIFDTQVLSIFRRRKEMGTLMAMGMTRSRIIQLFTLEGAMHAVLAAVLAAAYGLPLLALVARTGIGMPQAAEGFGYAMGNRLFPVFSAGLVAGTTLLVLVVTTIVSYLPTRRIARLKPTDALRGKMT